MTRFASILLAAALVPSAALADPFDGRSVAVPVHDVRFDDPAAVERLRGKLRVASRRVCAAEMPGIQAQAEAQSCKLRAMSDAEAQLIRMMARTRLARAETR